MGVMSDIDLDLRFYGIRHSLYGCGEQQAEVVHIGGQATEQEPQPVKKAKRIWHGKKHLRKADNKKIVEFFRSIVSDKIYRKSHKQIWMRSVAVDKATGEEKYVFSLVRCISQENFEEEIRKIVFFEEFDYYITKNSFFYDKRTNDSVFCFDNIVVDLDNHGGAIPKEDLDHEIERLVYILQNDEQGEFPAFNYVKSGRGVQLWIPFDSLYAQNGRAADEKKRAKINTMYQLATLSIFSRIKNLLKKHDCKLQVDDSSQSACSLCRLPFTFNSQSKTKAQYTHATDQRQQFYDFLIDYPIIVEQTGKEDKKYQSNANGDYTRLYFKRMRFVEQIIDGCNGNCDGRRELLIFCYMNYAYFAVGKDAATENAKKLNSKFAEPLSASELRSQLNSIASKLNKMGNPYALSKVKFFEKVQATTEERLAYDSISARETQRQQARQAKADRNEQIMLLHKQGCTSQEIAEKVGCSKRTVETLTQADKQQKKAERNQQIEKLHNEGYTQAEIAEKVGCCKRTVSEVLSKIKETVADQSEAASESMEDKTICVRISPVVYQSRQQRGKTHSAPIPVSVTIIKDSG